ncbi:MAG: protoheme IX farnesyltransferase [Leptospiraceae bacterium]|nr:protoheme IX farnesyltransferase [Leptospiraceae bacterium]
MLRYISIWNKLLKPRVSSLVLITVLPGIYLGSNTRPGAGFISIVLFGTFLMSSASFMLNQYIEKDLDAKMERTKNRPLPSGDIRPTTIAIVAFLFIVSSFFLLYYYVNLLTAICAFVSMLFYIFIYTILLKPRTDQNIVIGGIAGCVGPLIGYAASTNSLPLPGWILFLIIFFWTPPHFWALAIFLKEDYDAANFPMMPVIKGVAITTREILKYTLLYIACCIGFYFTTNRVGFLYLGFSIVLSLYMLYMSIDLYKKQTKALAKKFFFYSIVHLFAINIVIIIDFLSFHS